MKVYIEYDIIDDPNGGGNQFLKCLRDEFKEQEVLISTPKHADIILFNGHQKHDVVRKLKQDYPDKKFVHRLDGLQKLYNRPDDPRQDVALSINEIADGTVFQSEWAKGKFESFGFDLSRENAVIHNAVDGNIFNIPKIKLVTTSWSENWKKGFEIYKYLDDNLDFDKYEYYFIGNSPVKFKNIQMLGQLDSKFIASYLQQCDMFISAAQHDACSNSIIEALTCGLPVIALNDGGTVEMREHGILLFDEQEEINDIIELISKRKENIFSFEEVKNIMVIATEYIQFFYEVLNDK